MGNNYNWPPKVATVKVVGGSHTYFIHVERLGSCDAQLVINESVDPRNRTSGRPMVIVEPDCIFDFIRGFHDALLQSGVVEPFELGWFDALEVRQRHEGQRQENNRRWSRQTPKKLSKAYRVYALENRKKSLDQVGDGAQPNSISNIFRRALRSVHSRWRNLRV